MNSVKCPQCALINFASEEKCKRCGADISKVAEVVEQEQTAKTAAARHPNLTPCPDCERMISRQAEACPQCGRFIQRLGTLTVDRKGWAGTVALGIFLIGLLYALLTFLLIVLAAALSGRRY